MAFGTIDSWLIWNLTQGAQHVIEVSNASRTMLMNLSTQQWDEELLDLFNIPSALLPKIINSDTYVADTAAGLLGANIPITGILGDQQSALFGQSCFDIGTAKNTYGTGCFCCSIQARPFNTVKTNCFRHWVGKRNIKPLMP